MGPRLSLASPQVKPHTTMTQQNLHFDSAQKSLSICTASRPRVARAWSSLAAEFSRWPTLSPTKPSARSSGACLGPCLPLCTHGLLACSQCFHFSANVERTTGAAFQTSTKPRSSSLAMSAISPCSNPRTPACSQVTLPGVLVVRVVSCRVVSCALWLSAYNPRPHRYHSAGDG
jgi:hypothetical protein